MSFTVKQMDDHELNKFEVDANNQSMVRFFGGSGIDINPLAKYVEATYTNSDKTVTYKWYESSSKATLYSTITTTYSVAQDTSFVSSEWG